jgi:hypothetical protein
MKEKKVAAYHQAFKTFRQYVYLFSYGSEHLGFLAQVGNGTVVGT